jgi:IS1 family transposase
MNRLDREKQIRVLAALVEGNSIRATVRITGAAKNTIVKLLCDVGQACQQYQSKVMVNLPCKRLEIDEIWSFCYAKQRNVPEKYQGCLGYGDVWTFVALDPDTKLVPVWLVGERNEYWIKMFIDDLARRMANRVQITTDAFRWYYKAINRAFKGKVDYSQLIKVYGRDDEQLEKRYSPSKLLHIKQRDLIGRPVWKHISTSMVERQNLTMRMQMRRFTRLTNGFSRKIENLNWAVALHFMHYNFCRIHKAF